MNKIILSNLLQLNNQSSCFVNFSRYASIFYNVIDKVLKQLQAWTNIPIKDCTYVIELMLQEEIKMEEYSFGVY